MDESRLEQLDSLRGLAALSVVFHHCITTIPEMAAPYGGHRGGLVNVLNYSPLHIFWAGSEAVILFFVLSGFVLSLPYHKARAHGYGSFLVRRICRIYIPYIFAIAFSVAMRLTLSGRDVQGLSDPFQRIWGEPLGVGLLARNALLVVSFDTYQTDPVVWSLIHEMRISIIFPFIMWIVLRYRWHVSLAFSILLCGIGYLIDHAAQGHGDFVTLSYIEMFVVGALLARYRQRLAGACGRIRRPGRWAALSVASLCYSVAWWLPDSILTRHGMTKNLLICSGAAGLIVLALGSARFIQSLRYPFFLFLGRISYSLYLLHMIVLASVIHAFYGQAPLVVLLCVSVVLSIAIAISSYRFIELPSIRLGYLLASRFAVGRLHR